MASSTIHIALAFDERFWPAAYATMRSVCLTTRRRKDLVFYLCYPGLSKDAIEGLDKIASEFGSRLVHTDISTDETYRHFADSLPHTKYISAITYARMLFDRLIPGEVERLVYLDCDLLIRGPIEGLAEADLGSHPIGAVKDPHAMVFSNGRDLAGGFDLIDPADPYFNAGVLVIDLKEWRKMDMVAQLQALEANGNIARLINDQQILNHLFANNWKQLDSRWNMHATSKAIEALDPQIVHYTGPMKPWGFLSPLPFARVYRHVMTNEVFYAYLKSRWMRKLRSMVGLK